MTTSNNPPPSSSTPPDHTGLLIAAVVMAIAGWYGLYQLITTALPRIGGELWLFFLCLQVAISATVLPIIRWLNVRFTSIDDDVPPSGVIVRQSIWVGLFAVMCAWLQIPRALSVPLALFIAGVFIVVEIFIRTRELSSERG